MTLGIEGPEHIEILSGLKEGDRFVTTGAGAVRNNDQLIIAGDMSDGPSGGPGAGGPGDGRKFGGPGGKKFGGGEGGQPRKRPQGNQ